jgi:ribonuclease-3
MSLAYPYRQKLMQGLLQKLGLADRSNIRWDLLDLALTHPTFSATANYDQLEFVGDAVIRLATAEFLLEAYPQLSVGEFTALRSVLVSDRSLARIAQQYTLGRYLLLAESAAKDKLGEESRLAETFEALLAALYLSTHTLELIRPWLHPHLHELVAEIQADPARQNYKAALQEWTQATFKTLPNYRVTQLAAEKGVPPQFAAEVWFQGQCLGKGEGRSIKAAEQAAAQVAFQQVHHLASRPEQ